MRGEMDVRALFGPNYLRFYGPSLTDARSDADVELLWRVAGLEPGAEVLDAPCGHGRIANRLAAHGARVTGVDITPAFLELARGGAAAAGVDVEYVEGDLRDLRFERRFDAAVNWFTSFGYWDDETCRAVLAGFARALRPGGRLLLEHLNRDWMLRRLQDDTVAQVDDDFMIDRHWVDPIANRIHTDRTFVLGASRETTSFSIRLFTGSELRDWLLGAGFATVDVLGTDGEPFTLDSRRMLVRAILPTG